MVQFSIDLAGALLLVVAGTWSLYVYRTARRGQVKVAIEPTVRLDRGFSEAEHLLLVRLRIANTSSVLWRHEESLATLIDASTRTADGELCLLPFAQSDPFLPVYGALSDDEEEIASGQLFAYYQGQEISLEPGEFIDSELAFVLDAEEIGLMAMRVLVRGRQRRLGRRRYVWSSFFFIDPNETDTLVSSKGADS